MPEKRHQNEGRVHNTLISNGGRESLQRTQGTAGTHPPSTHPATSTSLGGNIAGFLYKTLYNDQNKFLLNKLNKKCHRKNLSESFDKTPKPSKHYLHIKDFWNRNVLGTMPDPSKICPFMSKGRGVEYIYIWTRTEPFALSDNIRRFHDSIPGLKVRGEDHINACFNPPLLFLSIPLILKLALVGQGFPTVVNLNHGIWQLSKGVGVMRWILIGTSYRRFHGNGLFVFFCSICTTFPGGYKKAKR